jgi:hypothetical protein
MKHAISFIAVMYAATLLMSCLSPYEGEEAGDGLPGDKTPIVVSELFTPAENENGKPGYRFFTNDTRYQSPTGYTLWSTVPSPQPAGDFLKRKITVHKPYGENVAGYGMVICSTQQVINEQVTTVFLTVMINNVGQYAVGKVIGTRYQTLVDWTTANGLDEGRVPNTVEVVRDTSAIDKNRYYLYFNDPLGKNKEHFFVDNIAPVSEGKGMNGCIVVISPLDIRDGGAVDVWFYE